MAKVQTKKRTKAKVRKNVLEGVVHIHATFNNTITSPNMEIPNHQPITSTRHSFRNN